MYLLIFTRKLLSTGNFYYVFIHLNDRKIIIYIEKEIDACYDKNSENCLKI